MMRQKLVRFDAWAQTAMLRHFLRWRKAEVVEGDANSQLDVFSSLVEFAKHHNIESNVLFTVLEDFGIEPDAKFIEAYREFEQYQNSLSAGFLNRIWEAVKAIRTPLRLIPSSLHPIDSVA